MTINLDESEIKKNKDGSKFMINYERIRQIIKLLTIISLDYPEDLYRCVYYLFKTPPPAAYFPIEKSIKNYNVFFEFKTEQFGKFCLNYIINRGSFFKF